MKIEIDGVEYLPAVDLSEVPTIKTSIHVRGYGSVVDAVLKSDLESIVPVKPCDCEAKVEELEVENASLRSMMSDADHAFKQYGKNCDKVVELEAKVRELEEDARKMEEYYGGIRAKNRDLSAELSTIRERLNLIVDAVSCGLDQATLPVDDDEAHAWVEQQVRKLREQGKWVQCGLEEIPVGGFFLVYDMEAKRWSIGLRDYKSMVSRPGALYWHLPTLPQPEEPKTIWMVRYKGIGGDWITRWHDSERSADDFLRTCRPEAEATKQAYTIEPGEPKQ